MTPAVLRSAICGCIFLLSNCRTIWSSLRHHSEDTALGGFAGMPGCCCVIVLAGDAAVIRPLAYRILPGRTLPGTFVAAPTVANCVTLAMFLASHKRRKIWEIPMNYSHLGKNG